MKEKLNRKQYETCVKVRKEDERPQQSMRGVLLKI
jgi:hypothetical protein